jgi:hypothetical protein
MNGMGNDRGVADQSLEIQRENGTPGLQQMVITDFPIYEWGGFNQTESAREHSGLDLFLVEREEDMAAVRGQQDS